MVASNVLHVLQSLYIQLDDELEGSGGQSGGGVGGDGACCDSKGDENLRTMRTFIRKLYSDGFIVGPLGERPLHVCALMAARFRGEIEDYGIQIADGIIDGMKEFLEMENGRWKDEVRSPYGRDYVAAVGYCIHNRKTTTKDVGGLEDYINELFLNGLPLTKVLVEWYIRRLQNVSDRLKSPRYKKHTDAMVLKGLYEGETILYPLIASGDENAVWWLLSLEEHMPQNEGGRR